MKLPSLFNRQSSSASTNPTVIVTVAVWTIRDGKLQTLLTEDAKGNPGLPSAIREPGEKLSDCVNRILPDTANYQHIFTEQVASVNAPANDTRGDIITISYVALTPFSETMLEAGSTLQLVPVDSLPTLAYDHSTILQLTLRRLKYNLEYTNLVHTLLPSEFSFTQLQAIYETILGRDLDRRNFRKKFMLLELIEETGGMSTGGAHRPAKLYRFIDRGTIELRHWL